MESCSGPYGTLHYNEPLDAGKAILFTQANYRGECIEFTYKDGNYEYSIANEFNERGYFRFDNDKTFYSMKLGSGIEVTVCTAKFLKGTCKKYTKDAPYLGSQELGAEINSFKIYTLNPKKYVDRSLPNDNEALICIGRKYGDGGCRKLQVGNYYLKGQTFQYIHVGRNVKAQTYAEPAFYGRFEVYPGGSKQAAIANIRSIRIMNAEDDLAAVKARPSRVPVEPTPNPITTSTPYVDNSVKPRIATAQNIDTDKEYKIINTVDGDWKGASLSWDEKTPHPMVSVEFDDPVYWKFQPVSGKANTYKIISQHPGRWKGASLSWDTKEPHPMISLEFNDPVEWRMDPVAGKKDTYKIVSVFPEQWKGASISWDSGSPHPMASLEFNDPVEWRLEPNTANNPTETSVNIKFENTSGGTFSIYWVKGDSLTVGGGTEVFYKTLNKNESYTQPTYVNHLWRVKFNEKKVGDFRATSNNSQIVKIINESYGEGPISNQQDANTRCASFALRRSSVWTGQWWTTVAGRMSVCQLAKIQKIVN